MKMITSEKSLEAFLVLCTMVGTASAQKDHFSPPLEENVFSPLGCATNDEGFGGSMGTNAIPVDYFYEMETIPGSAPDLDGIIFTLERSIADFLLQTSEFSAVPCFGRRLKAAEIKHLRDQERKLLPVGITTNPPDETTELSCINTPTLDNECYVIDGSFQIYTAGDPDDGLTGEVLQSLETAMDIGEFDDVHPNIVKITYIDELDPSEISDPGDDRGVVVQDSNTALIVAASAGAVLVVCAFVFYRRRTSKSDNVEEVTELGNSAS